MKKTTFFIIGILSLVWSGSHALAVSLPEKPEGFVTDTTGTLTSEEKDLLNASLKAYEEETGTEIAVAMIPSTEGMPIAQYAVELGNTWGVGKAKVDNGVLLLIAKDDRELFIATGSQTEGALTDIESKDVIDSVIVPRFKEGDFNGGILAGIDAIKLAMKGESFTDLRMGSSSSGEGGDFGWIFALIFMGFSWLGSILGRTKEVWPGAAIGGIGGGSLSFLGGFGWGGIIFSTLGMGLVGLIFDAFVSANYKKAKESGSSPSWWAGGDSFGGGGGGGFGGFGGGGFSGGGASGKW